MQDKVKLVLLLGILFGGIGIYNLGKAGYTSMIWNKTEGRIVDTALHNFKCGKRSQCYGLMAGYHVNGDYFMVESDLTFNDKPTHLMGSEVTIYYSPDDPQTATFGGSYGPIKTGTPPLVAGILLLFAYWFMRKRA